MSDLRQWSAAVEHNSVPAAVAIVRLDARRAYCPRVASTRGSALHLAGGTAALLIGVLYVVIIALYAQVGPAPADGAAVLAYLVGKGTVWWGIVLLSVLTDLLFVPLALSLYLALRAIGRSTMLVASALMVVFVPLDLAVTWTNHAVLLDLSALHSAATTDAQRAAAVAAATYASAVIASPLFPIYAIGTLSFAIFLMGLVMRRSRFGRIAAYLAIATGILGFVALSRLGVAVIMNALGTTAWVFVVGYRLLRLEREDVAHA